MPTLTVRGSLYIVVATCTLALMACGGSGNSVGLTQASFSDIVISSHAAGVTPFISSVQLTGKSLAKLKSIAFTIAPKPGTQSAPVNVTWMLDALTDRGYYGYGLLNLPVFGLYAGYTNQISINLLFDDASTQSFPYTITTAAYTDPHGIYDKPTINQARAPGGALGFNYFVMKSLIGSPAIIDTDAELRWVVPGVDDVESSIYQNGQFLIGSQTSSDFFGLQWDGTQSAHLTLQNQLPNLAEFTHNIDPGKVGQLAEFSGVDSYGNDGDAIVAEVISQTNLINQTFTVANPGTWDMAAIIETYMLAQGDNAAAFVRPGSDWFHLNAATYDPSDDTVIASSRENFLIKVDYTTGNIIWIFGDPTKYWYTFPSLRAKALTLAPGGLYPIGQHGISITSDGNLMVFNDGFGSINQPSGAPAGISRNYSAVSVYAINAAAQTATQVWNFDYGQSVFAAFCGSVYEAAGTYLVDYSTAANVTQDRLVGLDTNHNVAFDFQYASPTPCGTSWNAIPIPLENLQITP